MTRSICGLVALLFTLPGAATAQGALSEARSAYSECQRLLDKQKPCAAVEACKRGLEAKRLSSLEELNERAETLCVLKKKPREKACPKGLERSPETDGRCCWPGQVWGLPAGGDTELCVGKPTRCPEGYIQDAALATCRKTCDDEGRIETALGDCCWPGQVWSEDLSSCVGFPQCPERYEVGSVPRQTKKGDTREVEECVYSDQDGDGLYDAGENADECPALPEDKDGFEDEDGCPEPDNDLDGVCDASWSKGSRQDQLLAANCLGSDACPLLPEDPDGYEDGDGCPDLDHDADLICDSFPQGWSLPESTRDQWGCSGHDACVGAPETVNGYEDTDGCPDVTREELAALEAEEARRAEHLDFLNRMETGGWVTLGAGGALVVAGVVLLFEARSLELEVTPEEGKPVTVLTNLGQNDLPGIRDDIDLFNGLGGAALGVGGAALLAGSALLIIEAIWSAETDMSVGVGHEGSAWGVVIHGTF